ncbi:UDP-glucuronosyl/UDP-glucosyltransferase [Cinara cedri]|uniref:UDP-glucuronosyltransferase n=1 Tax=Cinara cedri TaxID=506608 RepID=A0A5E4MNA2_9HEMI|nr:UDP-glucuronosyl/UDP-glucosyltransferase [Cinara cedri]
MMIVVLLTTTIISAVISPMYTANILAVFPHHGYSHHAVYLPYIQELANRGHNMTVISNYPTEHPNITNISIRGSIPISNNKHKIDSTKVKPTSRIQHAVNIIWAFYIKGKINEGMFTLDKVKQLLNSGHSDNNYDLLITEHFNSELSLVFALHFNVPFIVMSSCNLLPWNGQVVGQPLETAVRPSTLSDLPTKMNFYHRTINTISNAVSLLGYSFLCRTRDEEIIKRHFNIDVSLERLISNASLILVNTHFTMFKPIPLVPAVVEIGGIHIQSITPLPTDIHQFIEGAEHGVIYFCMGSLIRGETLPDEKRRMFINVFKQIPQRILWKWEGQFPEKPSNVMIHKWMPQRDILAHPNVKLFITHGGLLGITEAVYEGIPILSIPIFGDQMTNVDALVDKGVAEMMDFDHLNEGEIFTKVKSMLTNPLYKKKAKELSQIFLDRPVSPMETAIYWTEYVIRHKGAPHLRIASLTLSCGRVGDIHTASDMGAQEDLRLIERRSLARNLSLGQAWWANSQYSESLRTVIC